MIQFICSVYRRFRIALIRILTENCFHQVLIIWFQLFTRLIEHTLNLFTQNQKKVLLFIIIKSISWGKVWKLTASWVFYLLFLLLQTWKYWLITNLQNVYSKIYHFKLLFASLIIGPRLKRTFREVVRTSSRNLLIRGESDINLPKQFFIITHTGWPPPCAIDVIPRISIKSIVF